MARWVRLLAVMPVDVSSVPGIHIVEGENQLLQFFTWLHKLTGAQCTHINTYNKPCTSTKRKQSSIRKDLRLQILAYYDVQNVKDWNQDRTKNQQIHI